METLTLEAQVPEILASLPSRVADLVRKWAKLLPDQPALIDAQGEWSYSQLNEVIATASSWLRGVGIRGGDRVMVVCENSRSLAALFLALTEIDAFPVLVNARLSAGELEAIRRHCQPRMVLYTSGASAHAANHAKSHGAAAAEIPFLGLIAAATACDSAKPEPVETDPAERVAAVIYTSGTTGLPKGIMLSHRNLLFIAAISARIRSLTPADRLYGVLPMSHAVGLSVVLLGCLMSGATLHIAARFDPMSARTALESNAITVLLGTPAMFSQFLDYAKMRRLRSLTFPALRIISSSGAPLQSSIKRDVEALFGMVLHNGYGITECSPTIAQTRVERPRNDISVGEIFPGVEVKLVGEDGSELSREGAVGELRVRGPNVMKGYYRAPEETAAVIDADGWFNTRDLARMEAGNLFIVGRTRELIVRSGLNVYPAEVENILNAHPEVHQSAVLGRTVNGNEEVLAFVQLSAGSNIESVHLREYLAQRLAAYKQPSHIFVVDSMPVTLTGKVIKGELAKRAELEACL